MNLSSTQKLIIAIVLIVVVFAAAFFLLILPQFSRLASMDDQIAAAEAEIESAEVLLERRQEIKSRAAATDARLLRLSNELPENPEMPALIIELQDTTNESGLEFVSLVPEEPLAEEGGYNSILSEMTVRGSWQDFVELTQRLRRLTRQIRIVGLEVIPLDSEGADAEEAEEDGIEGILTIEVYTMSMSDETSAAAAPPAPE